MCNSPYLLFIRFSLIRGAESDSASRRRPGGPHLRDLRGSGRVGACGRRVARASFARERGLGDDRGSLFLIFNHVPRAFHYQCSSSKTFFVIDRVARKSCDGRWYLLYVHYDFRFELSRSTRRCPVPAPPAARAASCPPKEPRRVKSKPPAGRWCS